MEIDFFGRGSDPFSAVTDSDAFFSIRAIRRLEVETRAKVFVMERFA